ncbi:hypothetical protein I4F81_001200 [Pyropia yezoensis]|uniref:Uncharacterized protein n=1 Tax=Pyropia yezoensis TaxID=2788 RepID=A0ACC3BKX2_PYRYE|nr:hypothetical protein I4F81_001200 [Neopyropia yezoensis]
MCLAYKDNAQEPIAGTDQAGRTSWSAVAADYRWRRSKVPLPTRQGVFVPRTYPTTSAVTKEMRDHVAKRVQRLASSFAAVDRACLTGNITAAQRELDAAAHFESRNMYDAIRGDVNEQQEAADLHVDKRAATWLSSWRILKDMDKFSGAAGSAAHRRRGRRAGRATGRARSSDRGGGAARGGGGREGGGRVAEPSVVEPSLGDDGVIDGVDEDWPAGLQPRPAGTKAVKALRAADLSAAREAEATRAALNRMARVAEHGADIAFRGGPEVRRTKEAAQWRRLEMRRRLKALADAALEDDVDDDTVEVGGAHAVTVMATCDSARRGHAGAAPAEEAAAAIVRTAPAGMSAEDGEWLDSLLTAPYTAVAVVSPVTAAAVTDGAV